MLKDKPLKRTANSQQKSASVPPSAGSNLFVPRQERNYERQTRAMSTWQHKSASGPGRFLFGPSSSCLVLPCRDMLTGDRRRRLLDGRRPCFSLFSPTKKCVSPSVDSFFGSFFVRNEQTVFLRLQKSASVPLSILFWEITRG